MRPSVLACWCSLALFLLAIPIPFITFWFEVWRWLALLAATWLIADLIAMLKPRPFDLERQLSTTLPVEVWSPVTIRLKNKSSQHIQGQVFDFYPADMAMEDLPISFRLPPQSTQTFTFRILPHKRGTFQFSPAQVLLLSPLKLWRQNRFKGTTQQVCVYPNFLFLSEYQAIANDRRTPTAGIHRHRRRGEGREFHQLREFVQGDPLRHIDWKASSRAKKLISREFKDERDQQVVFLLDCGQSMRAKDAKLGHFDHALNAVMVLAATALSHGDAVGMLTFAGHERRIAPRKGRAQLNLLLNGIFDIQPTLNTADYLAIAKLALVQLRKRALIVIVTNIQTEDQLELEPAVKLLRRRHLVMVASMREVALRMTLEQPVSGFESCLTIGATHKFLEERQQLFDRIRARGIIGIDTEPDHLPAAMVQQYMDIKRAGLL